MVGKMSAHENSQIDQIFLDYELPDGWLSKKLRDVVSNKKGKLPRQLEENPWSGSIPHIDIDAFERGNVKRHSDRESAVIVQKGDLIVVWDGARCGLVGKAPFEGSLGSTLMTLKPLQINSNYLFFLLRGYFKIINSNPRGIGIPHVEPDIFWNLEIPLPLLSEQQHIVTRVDALLTNVNAARDRLRRVPLIMKKFRQAVLTAACEGRLTEGWREENSNEVPASQLLQQIKKNRQEQKNQHIAKKSKNIQDVDVETTQDESTDIPDSWIWCQIQDITQVHLGGTPSRKESSYWGGAISWISSGEVANNRILTTKEKITDLGLQNSNAKLYPKGTVLIAMIGEGKTRGQSAILDIEATTNQNVAGLVFDTDKIFNEFVWLWALSQYEKTRAVGRGGEQPALNGEKVRNLMLALPPLAEQHEIVRRVGLLFERADAFDQEVAAASRRCERLTQAVLGKAFQGKL
ncbi:MAG: restriction endonuclease subunit S [Methanoregula sp.]|nr:restriction endonuclease subunit S [Methanoregula sp.]